MSHPPSTQSVEEILTNRGSRSGQTDLTAAAIFRESRILFSREPPYSSPLLFESGERNSCTRYPCAMCSSITWNPASRARLAAATKAVDDILDSLEGQLLGRRIAVGKGNRAGRCGFPAAVCLSHGVTSVPGHGH